MKLPALHLEQTVVCHFLSQRVLEAVGGVLAGCSLVQEFESLKLLEMGGQLGCLCPHGLEHSARYHTPENGGRLEQALRLFGQSLDPRLEHTLHCLRHGDVGAKLAALRDRSRDLLEEEWIALGPAQNDLGQRRG